MSKIQLKVKSFPTDYSFFIEAHPTESLESITLKLVAFINHRDQGMKFTSSVCQGQLPDLANENYCILIGVPKLSKLNKLLHQYNHVYIYHCSTIVISEQISAHQQVSVRFIRPDQVKSISSKLCRRNAISLEGSELILPKII